MSIDAKRFRAIMGCFPAGVSVVTAIDAEGEPRGLTSTAICSVSAEPAMLLVCVDRGSNTLPALRHSGAFVVNILAGGREELSGLFASKRQSKFRDLAWYPSEVAGGAPILADHCVSYAECRCVREVEAGDHVIFIGEVEGGEVMAHEMPIVFRQGVYRTWPLDGRRAAASAAAPSRDVGLREAPPRKRS